MTSAWRANKRAPIRSGAVNYTHLVLALSLAAVAAAMFARAKHTTNGQTERSSRFAATMLSVAAIAFFVAFGLSAVTAR